jgi:hypothetical protein
MFFVVISDKKGLNNFAISFSPSFTIAKQLLFMMKRDFISNFDGLVTYGQTSKIFYINPISFGFCALNVSCL